MSVDTAAPEQGPSRFVLTCIVLYRMWGRKKTYAHLIQDIDMKMNCIRKRGRDSMPREILLKGSRGVYHKRMFLDSYEA